MKKSIVFIFLLLSISTYSHTINYENQILRDWNIQKENRHVSGSFSMFKNGIVYIEDGQNTITKHFFASLSKKDQSYVKQRVAKINAINTIAIPQNGIEKSNSFYKNYLLIILLILGLTYYLYKVIDRKKMKFVIPIISFGLLLTLYSFTKKLVTITDPNFVNSAFIPFIPNVATSWDNTYFYVQSKGIPNHTMMVGISNHGWQQQVPVPQCYIGTNHWSIPLNPVVANSPIPIDNVHFTRGAIAIAANGVPIFNYHTNTGVDSYLDGQLDNFGGHCGRADDYHYHIAPLHLYSLGQTTTNLPCAFALDGYAVYGNVEPDGSTMTTLDANHGHYGSNGIYHYHGTSTAPYMIGNFMGQVTEDATYQLIPQAAAHPVRNENWTPLSGALITSCVANANNNGYNVAYTLNGTPGYATNFSWNGTTYTYNYVTPTGTTTNTYNGFSQCNVPLATTIFNLDNAVSMFPNPSKDILNITINNQILENDFQGIYIYSMKGDLVLKTNKFKSGIDIENLSKGSYLVKIQFSNNVITKKLIVQ